MKSLLLLIASAILLGVMLMSSSQAKDSTDTEIIIENNIFEAIHNIDIVSLNVLLAEGTEIDTLDEAGNTPLMLSAKIGNPRMTKIILAHNPDINAKNKAGKNALMIAAEHGQTYIAQQLINKGADVTARNPQGLSSLEIAVRNGHSDIIDLLSGNTQITLS